MKRLRLLTFLAALALLLCCVLPTKAEAATSGYYTYEISGSEATIPTTPPISWHPLRQCCSNSSS